MCYLDLLCDYISVFSFLTTTRVSPPDSYQLSTSKTHREERLCLDPHCNDFHMCSPSPFFFLFLPSHLLTPLPPHPLTSHSHFSPIPPPSCPSSYSFSSFSSLIKKQKNGCHLFSYLCHIMLFFAWQMKMFRLKKSDCGTYLLLSWSAGEREEVHAAPGQPEGARRGEEFYVQQAHILHL